MEALRVLRPSHSCRQRSQSGDDDGCDDGDGDNDGCVDDDGGDNDDNCGE